MNCRGTLETKDGIIIAVHTVAKMEEAEKERFWLSAASVVRMQVKDALQGLSPVYGAEFLTRMCAEVIAEDEGGPQTKSYQEHQDEQIEREMSARGATNAS